MAKSRLVPGIYPAGHRLRINGMKATSALQLTFRELTEHDASAVLVLVGSVLEAAETTITSREEFVIEEEQERTLLRSFQKSACNLALGAFHDGRLVGVLFMEQLPKRRNRHRATLGMSVDPSMWGQGIGSNLLQVLLGMPEALRCFEQLEASVLSNNPASLRIMKSARFQPIGTVPNAVLLNGTSIDETFFVLKLQ